MIVAYARFEHSGMGPFALAGAFASRVPEDWQSWFTGDGRLGIGVQDEVSYVLEYRADDPEWVGYLPPRLPELTFYIPNPAARISVELETHADEPAFTDDDSWDFIEQGGGEFGHLPLSVQPLIWSSRGDHDRIVGPVLDSIPDGWNMIRVSCRDLRPETDALQMSFDIWPIAGSAGREIIRQPLTTAPPLDADADARRELAVAAHEAPTYTGPLNSKELENLSLLVRTDYSDADAWIEVVNAALAPTPVDGFSADLALVDDPTFDGATVEQLVLAIGDPPPFYIFVADRRTLTDPEHPILAVNIGGTQYRDEHGRTVRVTPAALASVENNLALSNMDFAEFADAADDDGIFRSI